MQIMVSHTDVMNRLTTVLQLPDELQFKYMYRLTFNKKKHYESTETLSTQ